MDIDLLLRSSRKYLLARKAPSCGKEEYKPETSMVNKRLVLCATWKQKIVNDL